MNPHVAQRLLDALTHADLAYYLRGISHAEFLRQQANLHRGDTRRQLLRIAELPDIPLFIETFLENLND